MNKFLSRKLTVTVGTVVSLVVAHQFIPAAVVAVTYLLGQAHVDAAEVRKVAAVVVKAAPVVAEVASEVAAA